ncbi:MAG TPA: diguanylate cyclase [Deltaproteobacteria bacterium]|nr:diguanylate cyclase [Deltaproteobacteria bacterium]HPR56166.1 diguanylate cyclase [Deltaproteobacteria bacterium]HXK48666.1 diguanylate cyclase [Deltaproteobacteria bacterium]
METRKPTILIVDDSRTNIMALSDVLSADYNLLFASSGLEGLKTAASYSPDIILLDIIMADMDGYEVCRKLKSNSGTKNIPIIFVTAMGKEEDEIKGLEMGGLDYITKPFNPIIVRARVRVHLELKRHRDFLENLVATDGLTGIPNRRQFNEFLVREWRRAMRSRLPISLILMDIDHFKLFNDHYGHLAGDDCLRRLAQAVAGCARRPADLVARYGGEELACILPDTNLDGALVVANCMREKVNALKIPHTQSHVAEHITMSLGVATLIPVQGRSWDDLISAADENLYEAKRKGRDRVGYPSETTTSEHSDALG